MTLGGRRVSVRRPRVRTVGDDEHELPVASYETFVSADLLADGVVARMLGGLSTRGYRVGLESIGSSVEQHSSATSHSAVSRRFVTATAERLTWLLQRPLGGQRWLVVFLDGFSMGEHLLVGALGVTADGTKVPLGVGEGTTENTAVCTRLVTGLGDRGLNAERGVLFVLDRDHAGRVKRWSSGEMALRWAAAGMLAAGAHSAASSATRSSLQSPPRPNTRPPTSRHSTSRSPPDRTIRHEAPTQV